ncbi:hypothetical protein [Hymenobacter crusticola]|uniref:hypothetical protein n=1 Tax=Hymenobacter crusticola TaxID=1770526 RepID=UPI0015C4EBAC|nr:hypothetical protein [Hymenobacter crusticola]
MPELFTVSLVSALTEVTYHPLMRFNAVCLEARGYLLTIGNYSEGCSLKVHSKTVIKI